MPPIPRTVRSMWAGAILCLTLVAACTIGDAAIFDDDVAPALRYGGTAVVGGLGEPQSMNPLVSTGDNSGSIQRDLLLMTLVRYDDRMRPTPWLAEAWDTVRIHPDSLELTWRLRKDVRWHDGEPTTGEDLVFTFQRMTEPLTGFPHLHRLEYYNRGVKLVDPYTVRMRLRAHANFLDVFAITPVVPRHVLGDVAPEELYLHPYGHRPTGNGPFRFVRYVPRQEWVFEANPDFPEALGGRPFLDRFIYRFVPEMSMLLTELLTGGIDVYLGPNPNQAETIDRSEALELRVGASRQYLYLGFNSRLPAFRDARTRRAITMAIDRAQIVDAIIYGYGVPGRATVPPTHPAYDSNAYLPHDPETARQLLAEAGWRPGRDGLLEDAAGRPFRFNIITNAGNDFRRDIAEILQEQLRRVGVVAQPRVLEWATLVQRLQGSVNAEGVREREFEAVISGWTDWEHKDDRGLLHSRHLQGPYHYSGYSDPRFDNLLDSLSLTLDPGEAEPLWADYQGIFTREAPFAVLYYPSRLTGVRKRLRDAEFDLRGDLAGVQRWWIHPAERQ